MNRIRIQTVVLTLILPWIFVGCGQRNSEDLNEKEGKKGVEAQNIFQVSQENIVDIGLEIDLRKSLIRWKGTKMMKTGKHEGTVNFKKGVLYFRGERLTGGYLSADMRTITVTDIPDTDPIPKQNLTTHLNSDFDTDHFPSAGFKITDVRYDSDDKVTIEGEFTVKDVTKSIQLSAEITRHKNRRLEFNSSFSFNRFEWNIGVGGSWLEKKLVDEDIHLTLEVWTMATDLYN